MGGAAMATVPAGCMRAQPVRSMMEIAKDSKIIWEEGGPTMDFTEGLVAVCILFGVIAEMVNGTRNHRA